MMKILIVDDEPLARERLHALVNEIGIGKVIGEASNGKEALLIARGQQPQLVLLDIRMPAMDGMQTAEQLALLHPQPVVIFITAYGDRALEAFERQAIDYLLKPVRKERLEQALKRAYTLIYSQSQLPSTKPAARTHISYYIRGELRLIAVTEIYYFFAHQKYVVLRWKEGEILISEPLKQLEQEFAGQFLRVHRSTLVALVKVVRLSKDNHGHSYLQLKDIREPLEVSRRHLPKVKKVLRDMRIPCS
jgi:two-component system response regulator AlgR